MCLFKQVHAAGTEPKTKSIQTLKIWTMVLSWMTNITLKLHQWRGQGWARQFLSTQKHKPPLFVHDPHFLDMKPPSENPGYASEIYPMNKKIFRMWSELWINLNSSTLFQDIDLGQCNFYTIRGTGIDHYFTKFLKFCKWMVVIKFRYFFLKIRERGFRFLQFLSQNSFPFLRFELATNLNLSNRYSDLETKKNFEIRISDINIHLLALKEMIAKLIFWKSSIFFFWKNSRFQHCDLNACNAIQRKLCLL